MRHSYSIVQLDIFCAKKRVLFYTVSVKKKVIIMNKNSIDRITFWLVIWILIFGNLGFGLTTMAFATGLDYLAPYGWLGMPPPVLPGVRAGLSFHASCLLATGIAFVVALAAATAAIRKVNK